MGWVGSDFFQFVMGCLGWVQLRKLTYFIHMFYYNYTYLLKFETDAKQALIDPSMLKSLMA